MAGGRFPQAWLDELRERADIVQVVSRYVQLNSKGGRYWGLCPFHGEKTASFSVNPQRQMYYCFGCHAGGSAINFVMEMEHLEFKDAVKLLAEQVHMELPEMVGGYEDAASKTEKERIYEANRQCARFFHSQLWKQENEQVLAYLYNRGLDDQTIRMFGLGSTPPRSDGATQAMRSLGFTDDELVRAGISVRRAGRVYDMFRQRAIFPIIDAQGRVLGFGGRALGDVKPKYLNTGDTPVFNKRLGVFAANLLKKQRGLKRVILVEGYMDVIALTQAGLPGVCATLGTALTIEQARMLKRYAPEIWVSYDGDAAGQHAILRALEIFDQEGIRARVLDFPGGMDPDDFIREYGAQGLESLEPMDATSYRMKQEMGNHDLSTQEGRTAYAIACAKHLAKVKEPVELENYVSQLMISTGFTRDVLLAQIGRTEMIAKEKRSTYRHAARPLEEKNEGVSLGAAQAEKQLLRLLAEGHLEPGTVTAEDFITQERREFAEKLLAGMSPGAILEEIADEDRRARAASVLSSESGASREDELRMAGDCLRILHYVRIDEKIAALKQEAAGQKGEDKRKTLMKIQELTKDRQKAGRKE
ncbi:MAG: DNA primase [Clostridia bacterium]|nr:DNA primase [Clostridia bacterium]